MNLYDRTFVSEEYNRQFQEACKSYQLCRLVRELAKHAYARWLDTRTRSRQTQQPQAAHSLEHKLHARH